MTLIRCRGLICRLGGQLVLDGVSPYAAAYSIKTPGVALVYAPFVRLLGDTPVLIRSSAPLPVSNPTP